MIHNKHGTRTTMSTTARRSFVSVIGASFVLSILAAPGHALTPGQVFNAVKDAVVVVKTVDTQGRLKAQGSGVLISPGRVATNCHVVERGAFYQVGSGEQFVRATLYAEDWDKDICLLDATGVPGNPARLGKVADLKVGDPVYAVGAPQGLEHSLSAGIVAQLRGGPPPLIQTTAAISPGSSGGGLFDGEGRLVGLTTRYLEGGQSLNFAMPVEWISEIQPGRTPVAEGGTQTEWSKRAFTLEAVRDWQGLLDWCREWTKSDPENATAWHMLGLALSGLGRFTDAVDAFRGAVLMNPENAISWRALGSTFRLVGRDADAVDALRQAVRLNQEDALAWHGLGDACRRLERYDLAVDAFRQAVHLDPANAYVWRTLGRTYHITGRYDLAVDAFRQAVRVNPKYGDAWENLGVTYGDIGRYDLAIDAFRKALGVNPKDVIAWRELGEAYHKQGDRTSALNCVRELRRLDPALADTLFNLIMPR